MYIVVFNKTERPIYFGPFPTAEKARSFIEKDTEDHQPYMSINRLVSSTFMGNGQRRAASERRDELVRKDIISN